MQAFEAHGIDFFSVPNEGHGGNARRAMYLKALGQKNGVADLVVLRPGRVVFLEVKTAKGRQSKDQKAFQAMVQEHGFVYFIVRSVAEALDAVASACDNDYIGGRND